MSGFGGKSENAIVSATKLTFGCREISWMVRRARPLPRPRRGSGSTTTCCRLRPSPKRHRTCPKPVIRADCGDHTQLRLALVHHSRHGPPRRPGSSAASEGGGIPAHRGCRCQASRDCTEDWRTRTTRPWLKRWRTWREAGPAHLGPPARHNRLQAVAVY